MPQITTNVSWGTRLKNAIVGILFGVILIPVSIYFIFWNETSSLHTQQSLKQTQQTLIEIPNTPVNLNNNLKPVYLYGMATTTEVLTDSILGVSANAITLKRKVNMYQWEEHKNTSNQSNMGGSETVTTTYSYTKVWKDSVLQSQNYHEAGHNNPAQMAIPPRTDFAKKVMLGDFILPDILLAKINNETRVSLNNINLAEIKARTQLPIKQLEDSFYVGRDPQNPEIGDLQINVTAVLSPQSVSVIAQQYNNTLQPFIAPAGKSVALLAVGIQPAAQLLSIAHSENRAQTWTIRLFTFIGLYVAFFLIMQPIVILADLIPFFGRIIDFGTSVIALVASVSVWLIATSIAWFAIRPIISILLIGILIVFLFGVRFLRKKKNETMVA